MKRFLQLLLAVVSGVIIGMASENYIIRRYLRNIDRKTNSLRRTPYKRYCREHLSVDDRKQCLSYRFGMDDIVFNTRCEAERVLQKLEDIERTYRAVTLQDLYDIIGKEDCPWTANDYGWTSLIGARIFPTTNGYRLVLPRPISLV